MLSLSWHSLPALLSTVTLTAAVAGPPPGGPGQQAEKLFHPTRQEDSRRWAAFPLLPGSDSVLCAGWNRPAAETPVDPLVTQCGSKGYKGSLGAGQAEF